MRKLVCFIGFVFILFKVGAQTAMENGLLDRLNRATETRERIAVLGQLSDFYYQVRADKKGDSLLQLQILEAELSDNEEILLKTLFSKSINNVPSFSSAETFDRTLAFIEKGLEYARNTNSQEYEALSLIWKADLLRKRGKFDEAMQQATLAFPLLSETDDSLTAAFYLELGDIFFGKGESVSAFKNFNKAYDIAYSIKNDALLSSAFHHYASVYQQLGNRNQAKNSLLESLELNERSNHKERLVEDYIALAKLTDEKEYILKAMELSKQLNSFAHQLATDRLMFYYLMVIEKNSEKTLSYLESHQLLKQSFLNQGRHVYFWTVGNVYHYGNRPDSAIRYYLIAEPEMMARYDDAHKRGALNEIASCYMNLGKSRKAIEYYEKALEIGKKLNAVNANANNTAALSKLYSDLGQYEKAFEYSQAHMGYSTELNRVSEQKDVALLNIERERIEHEQDLKDAEEQAAKRRDIQYMAISLATVLLFVVLLFTGMFPVSKLALKMLNFMAFICLFELAILLIDNWLHHAAHGEPLKIWLAKIVIIGILLPFHHYVEHLGLHFLESKRLMRFRERFSLKKLFRPSRQTMEKLEKKLEESPFI